MNKLRTQMKRRIRIMQRNDVIASHGNDVGSAAADHALQRAEEYCEAERQRIEAVNQPKINALKAGMTFLMRREEDLQGRIRHAPPAGDTRNRRRKSLFYWTTCSILWLVSIALAVFTLAPYRLGWVTTLICAGIALAAPFGLDELLERFHHPWLSKGIT